MPPQVINRREEGEIVPKKQDIKERGRSPIPMSEQTPMKKQANQVQL